MSHRSRRRLRVVGAASDGGTPVHADDLAALVERATAGERDAFDEVVRRTHGDAYGLAYRLTGDQEDARDVVQDAYLRAYRALASFRNDARFSTWLYRIVANCAATHTGRRRRDRHEVLSDDSQVPEVRADHDPVELSEASDLRRRVDAAVRELPPRLRAVVVLRDTYDLPHDAIAEELGISVSAAKVRLHRARRQLRERVFTSSEEDRHAV